MQRDIRFASALLGRRREFFHMTQPTPPELILALKAHGAEDRDILKLASLPNIDWAKIEALAVEYGGGFLKKLVEALFPTRT